MNIALLKPRIAAAPQPPAAAAFAANRALAASLRVAHAETADEFRRDERRAAEHSEFVAALESLEARLPKTIAAESLNQPVEVSSAALRVLISDTRRAISDVAEAAAVARERCNLREQGDLKRLTARLAELDGDRDRLAIAMLRARLELLAPEYIAKRDAFIAAEREVFGLARAIDRLAPKVPNSLSAGSGTVRDLMLPVPTIAPYSKLPGVRLWPEIEADAAALLAELSA